jgi:hypothetical protein
LNQLGRVVVFADGRIQQQETSRPQVGGPVWFRKMDRNGDGDVSRREFLGTKDQFRQVDADGDGIISPEEAEQADATLRKAKQ